MPKISRKSKGNPQSEHLFTLATAARLLAARISPTKVRIGALTQLAVGFGDVELPTDPMRISGKEAKQLRREIALELSARFAAAAKAAKTRPLSRDEFEQLAAAVDPLWVALAAIEWDLVSKIEAAAQARAQTVVGQITAQAVASDIEPREMLQQILQQLQADNEAPAAIGAMLGVSPHHLKMAIAAILG